MAEEQLRRQTPDVVLLVGEGGDAGRRHLAVLAVVKADDRDVPRDGETVPACIARKTRRDLVVVADDRAAGGDDLVHARLGKAVLQKAVLLVGAVPENVVVLQRQAELLHGVQISGEALPALDVVIFKNAGDFPVPLAVQIIHQHAPARGVVVQHREGAGQRLVVAVHENHGNALFHQLPVEPDVGIGKPGLGPLHQNAVELLHLQQRLKDLPLIGKLVLRGEKKGRAVVLRAYRLDLAQDAGEDIVADIGGDDGDRAPPAKDRLPPLADVRAAALPPVDQALRLQQRQSLPDRLAAHLKPGAEQLLRRERLLVCPVPDPRPERLGHDLILWIHKRTPVISTLS